MRVVGVRIGTRQPVDLHPRVTVVGGLDDEHRREVVAALRELARGRLAPGAAARIEAHGILIDAEQATLDALGLPSDIEPVIAADDLPGQATARSKAALARAEVELAGRVDEHREAVVAAEEAGPPPDAEALRADLESATRRRIEAEAAATERAVHRRETVAELERTRADAADRAEGVRIALAEVPAGDPAVVAAALEALERVLAAEPTRVAEADALAERLRAIAPDISHEPPELRAARRRVEHARGAVLLASAHFRGDVIGAEDIAELEAAHREREVAEERVERARLPVPTARRRLAAARDAERAVLDRLGLPSYGAFLIRVSTMQVQPENTSATSEAAAELAAAEAAWAEVAPTPVDHAERDELLLAARALLGADAPDDPLDLPAALRELRAKPDPSEPAGELVRALAGAGETASAGDPTALAEHAWRWLGEGPLRAERAAALEADLVGLEAEVQAAAEALAVAAAELDQQHAEASAVLDEARAAEAEARRALEAAAGNEVMAVAADVDRRAAAVAIAEAALAAARSGWDEVRAAEDAAADATTVLDLEVWFLARLAGLRAPGCTGPSPVVVDDALTDLDDDLATGVLALLERASETHQVIYVGGDDRVRSWAGGLGRALASVT